MHTQRSPRCTVERWKVEGGGVDRRVERLTVKTGKGEADLKLECGYAVVAAVGPGYKTLGFYYTA